jgi:hypothetical protein
MDEYLSQDELLTLLNTFQQNNEKHGITGLLLYHTGNVIQLFEGPPQKTKQLLENLKNDNRHSRFSLLLHDRILTRNFPDWHMGFITKNSEQYNTCLFNKTFSNHRIALLFKTFQKITRN